MLCIRSLVCYSSVGHDELRNVALRPKKTNPISDWSFLLLIAGLEFVVGATLMLCETQSTLGSGVSEEEQSKRLF